MGVIKSFMWELHLSESRLIDWILKYGDGRSRIIDQRHLKVFRLRKVWFGGFDASNSDRFNDQNEIPGVYLPIKTKKCGEVPKLIQNLDIRIIITNSECFWGVWREILVANLYASTYIVSGHSISLR